MYRRDFLLALAAPPVRPFPLAEATIAELGSAIKAGKYTARSLAHMYLSRIEAIDRQGPVLVVTTAEWEALLARVRAGELDLP